MYILDISGCFGFVYLYVPSFSKTKIDIKKKNSIKLLGCSPKNVIASLPFRKLLFKGVDLKKLNEILKGISQCTFPKNKY